MPADAERTTARTAGDEGADGFGERAAAAAQVFVDDLELPRPGPDDLHHLARVLRLRDGEPVVAADGRGGWLSCRFRRSGPQGPGLVADGPVRRASSPAEALTVAFAPVKGERAEWVVQKLTELGIDHIVPLVADRSVVRWRGARAGAALDRLRRVAREAAAQSRRLWLPAVEAPVRLDELVAAGPDGLALADVQGPAPVGPLRAVAVGPEGGWSTGERSTGVPTFGLGHRVLRAETAAVAAGVLLAALRDGTVALGPGPATSGPEGREGDRWRPRSG